MPIRKLLEEKQYDLYKQYAEAIIDMRGMDSDDIGYEVNCYGIIFGDTLVLGQGEMRWILEYGISHDTVWEWWDNKSLTHESDMIKLAKRNNPDIDDWNLYTFHRYFQWEGSKQGLKFGDTRTKEEKKSDKIKDEKTIKDFVDNLTKGLSK